MTGYVAFSLFAKKGVSLSVSSHAEILDRDGNFYTETIAAQKRRSNISAVTAISPTSLHLAFLRVPLYPSDAFPGTVDPEQFTAIVLHSKNPLTGWLSSPDPLLNRLFENYRLGPKEFCRCSRVDCPQRTSGVGWTGDAQVFVRTAAISSDVRRFFQEMAAFRPRSRSKEKRSCPLRSLPS